MIANLLVRAINATGHQRQFRHVRDRPLTLRQQTRWLAVDVVVLGVIQAPKMEHRIMWYALGCRLQLLCLRRRFRVLQISKNPYLPCAGRNFEGKFELLKMTNAVEKGL